MFPDLEFKYWQRTHLSKSSHEWVENNFLPKIQQEVQKLLTLVSFFSYLQRQHRYCGKCKHKTRSGDVFNAAVLSDGSYDIAEGVFLAFL